MLKVMLLFGVLLIIHIQSLVALQCYQCDGTVLNYTLTIDNIPLPTGPDCKIVQAKSTCSVRVGWVSDGTSEIYYSVDQGLPADSILALAERRVITWSGLYTTRKFIFYTCNATNTTPCNTVENVKRVIRSTTLPNDDQIQKFDSLLVPTTDFDGRTCLQISNTTDCVQSNLISCQQCMGILEDYQERTKLCTMCPAGKAIANFFDYSTTFFLNDQTRLDTIKLGCRKYGTCNSIENLKQFKNTLTINFNFQQFNHATTTSQLSIMMILFIILTKEI